MAVEQSIQADCLDGNIAFLYDLPETGLALRSVSITNGLPEIKFESLSNVPTLTEGDFATAFRLASENVRPGFAYFNFPPFHPLESRWYMQYTPSWLRWTDVGKLLADADWIMKGLHVGVRTDEAKKVYKSWKKSSHLQGLRTKLDFPDDPESTDISVWMSCEIAEVQEGEHEICFPIEPKMQIKDGFRALYSEYITKIYPSVAYHDEPKLLKMQELIKLILAVEWLWKKGVRVNQEWIQLHTSESTDGILSKVLLQKRKKLPHEMIPTPSNTNRPTIDVRISTSMASEGKEVVKKSEEQQFYGYYDCNNTEMKIFSETGKLLSHQKSLKISFQHNSYPAIGLYFPIIQSKTQKIKRQLCKPLPKIQKEITDRAPELGDIALERNKSGTVQMKINKVSDSNPLGENTLTVSATMNDDLSGMLAGMNPNDPIPGVCDAIVPPAVSSWDELITEFTVPRPSVWLYSGSGNPVLTTSGGISTRDFPVKTKRLEERVYDRQVEERDIYKKEGHTVTVRAQCVVAQGKIQFVGNSSAEFIRVSQQFTVQWTKGTPPQVKFVFSICNEFLMQNWHSYKQILKSRGHTQEAEDYFHGTELACDLVRTKALCSDGRCGICGISSAGMDSKCISKNSFQRFGQGFYLAPNSSKCDAYGNRNIYGHKAMLLCKVLPGKKFLLSDRQQQLTRPPSGYDSVYGVVGSELNYPEIVIYDQRAVLPKYIIIY